MNTDDIIEDSNLEYLKARRRADRPSGGGAGARPSPRNSAGSAARVPRVNGAAIVTGRGQVHPRPLLRGDAARQDPPFAARLGRGRQPGSRAGPRPCRGQGRPQAQGRTGQVLSGEPIAAVAAVDERTAEEALKLIKVEYKVLPHVVSAEAGMAANAPQVHDTPNVQKSNELLARRHRTRASRRPSSTWSGPTGRPSRSISPPRPTPASPGGTTTS